MEKHFSLSDTDFVDQFENATLQPELFSHEAHLRLAWIHIDRYGVEKAIKNICSQIARFDRIHDDGTKFHKTLTVAAIYAVAHFISRSSSDNFRDFIEEFPRLKYHFRELIGAHYSWDVFADAEAKHDYVPPDRLSFD